MAQSNQNQKSSPTTGTAQCMMPSGNQAVLQYYRHHGVPSAHPLRHCTLLSQLLLASPPLSFESSKKDYSVRNIAIIPEKKSQLNEHEQQQHQKIIKL